MTIKSTIKKITIKGKKKVVETIKKNSLKKKQNWRERERERERERVLTFLP